MSLLGIFHYIFPGIHRIFILFVHLIFKLIVLDCAVPFRKVLYDLFNYEFLRYWYIYVYFGIIRKRLLSDHIRDITYSILLSDNCLIEIFVISCRTFNYASIVFKFESYCSIIVLSFDFGEMCYL